MTSAAVRPMAPQDRRSEAYLDEEDLRVLSQIFEVPEKDITVSKHPIDGKPNVITIKFLHGVNLPSALAAFFNSDFYDIPKSVEKVDLHYVPNPYAFVDQSDFGLRLFLSIPDARKTFIRRLQGRVGDIQYVMQHPEILFMLRPNPNYHVARRNIEHGYLPAL